MPNEICKMCSCNYFEVKYPVTNCCYACREKNAFNERVGGVIPHTNTQNSVHCNINRRISENYQRVLQEFAALPETQCINCPCTFFDHNFHGRPQGRQICYACSLPSHRASPHGTEIHYNENRMRSTSLKNACMWIRVNQIERRQKAVENAAGRVPPGQIPLFLLSSQQALQAPSPIAHTQSPKAVLMQRAGSPIEQLRGGSTPLQPTHRAQQLSIDSPFSVISPQSDFSIVAQSSNDF